MNDEMNKVIGELEIAIQESPEDTTDRMVLAALAKLGGQKMNEDELKFQGTAFVLPEMYRGKIPAAVKFLSAHQKQQEEEHDFDREFKFRPDDVAAALMRALKFIFGTTGIGQATYSFFGKTNPAFRTIDVGPGGQTLQVPVGWTAFPPLEGQIATGATRDDELGEIGIIRVQCPRKYRGAVEGLFQAIEDQLKNGSIYRGQAISGTDHPKFMDLSGVDEKKVIYTQEVMDQLNANVWVLIEHTQAMLEHKIALKRTVLFEGPYGTGKSLGAFLTAQKAVRNGWTFVYCAPGDDLERTMRTAQLYAPAVVFFEDVDVIADENDPKRISRLLDTFDGIANKGVPLIGILTTNNVGKIHKGMLRPGRMDAVIHVGEPDEDATRRLILSMVPEDMLEDVDFAAVYKAFEGFLPAFIGEAVGRTKRYAIARNQGVMPEKFSTSDFVNAATGLRPQLDLMDEAKEAQQAPTLDRAFNDMMKDAAAEIMERSVVNDRDGDKVFDMAVNED